MTKLLEDAIAQARELREDALRNRRRNGCTLEKVRTMRVRYALQARADIEPNLRIPLKEKSHRRFERSDSYSPSSRSPRWISSFGSCRTRCRHVRMDCSPAALHHRL